MFAKAFADNEIRDVESPVAGYAPITYLQPICSVKTCAVFGVEALARGLDAAGKTIGPDRLFAEAAAQGLAETCELTCRQNAVAAFSPLVKDGGPLLFLNLNLLATSGDRDVANLLEISRQCSVPPQNIVVEVLESRFDDTKRLASILHRFREHGFLVALDDVGSGHSNLDRVPLIQPNILKVDRSLVQRLDSDYHRQGVFKALVYLARRIGALVVAEGVETESEAIMALELGADLLQGYFTGRPQSPSKSFLDRTETVVQSLAKRFKHHMVVKTSRQRQKHRQYNVLIETLLCNLTCSPSADFPAVLKEAVRKLPTIECVYILDETGSQVGDTVCRREAVLDPSCHIFRPAPAGTDHSLKEYYYMLLDAELPKYTTDPYVSLATGNLCQTISTCFRDGFRNRLYVLCIDVRAR